MGIPRRIIQTGKHRHGTLLEQAAERNVTLLHPEWEYCFFDDDDVRRFMEAQPHSMQRVFKSLPFAIQRFDFFRYLAVFELGGFYFDQDVFLAKSLDVLTGYNSVFPFEEITISVALRETFGLDWQIGNYAFGANAGNPYLAQVIANCARAVDDPRWTAEMLTGTPRWLHRRYLAPMTTGPGMLSRTFATNPALQRDVTILFPPDVRDMSTWHRFGDFGVHLMQGSWRPEESFLRNRAARFWETRQFRRLYAESQKLGPSRSGARPHPAKLAP